MATYSARQKIRERLVERRKYPRYRVTGDRLLVFRHSDKKIGWITDMSRGGLSYEYIPTSESKSEKEIIDIFAHGKMRLFLPGLNCRRIYDQNEKAASGSHSPVKFKRCGLKCVFSNKQAIRLDEMLINRRNDDKAY
jgi:hypothetical protein